MNPNYNRTITVFRKVDSEWEKLVFHNCFWKSGITVVQNGTEASQVNTYTVRIPLEAVGNNFSVASGDVVVLGECADEITGKSPCTASEVLRKTSRMHFSSVPIPITPHIRWPDITGWEDSRGY